MRRRWREGINHRTMLLFSTSEFWLLAVEKKIGCNRGNLSLGFIISTSTAVWFLNVEKNLYLSKHFLSIGAHSVYGYLNGVTCRVSSAVFSGLFKDHIFALI